VIRNLKLGPILDALAWTKTTLAIAMATPPGSPQRAQRLAELRAATTNARTLAQSYTGERADEIQIALHVAELGLRRLAEKAP
jgi:hypothetical protein